MSAQTVRNLRRLSQILFFGIFFWLILNTAFDVEAPSVQGAVEVEALQGNANLCGPPFGSPSRGRLPDRVPLGVLPLSPPGHQGVVAGPSRVHGEDVPGTAVQERIQDDLHIVLGP